jgi:hypothetical protein
VPRRVTVSVRRRAPVLARYSPEPHTAFPVGTAEVPASLAKSSFALAGLAGSVVGWLAFQSPKNSVKICGLQARGTLMALRLPLT